MLITSEIKPLKQVILHRPEISLRRLTPSNCKQLLFDDVLWPERAAEEHDVFAQILRDHGVEVLLVADLLEQTLTDTAAKDYFISQALHNSYQGSFVEQLLSDYLHELSPKNLVSTLIGGLTFHDLGGHSMGLISKTKTAFDFLLPPLPNQLFTRDSSCWIGHGVCINPMQFEARAGETDIMGAIYKFHPRFRDQEFPIWYDGSNDTERLPSIEGGDMLVISKDCLLVGLSQRTKPQSVEILSKRLFKAGVIKQVIAVDIPKSRASMHLDTVMSMLDEETFCTAFPSDDIPSWSLTPGDHEEALVIEENEDFFQTVAYSLGLNQLRLLHPGGDYFEQERAQWTDASNLLAIAPGQVIAYECNNETNEVLEKAGIEVFAIPGSELGRGRGGSRCMSCPILREA